MLASARVLGHVFDPLSVFWCYDSSGRLACIVAEVHNTYGERHAYLLHPDEAGIAVTGKDFHVSPFFDVTGTYGLRFTLSPDRVSTTVTLRHEGAVVFSAAFRGRPEPATPPGPGPAAHPPAPDDPAGLGPDPGARHLALAAWPAHPLSPEPHPSGRDLNMTVSTSIGWPALAKRPRAPMRATVARLIFERAVGRDPRPRHLSRRPGARWRLAGVARVRGRPPRRVLRPARPGREDRIR